MIFMERVADQSECFDDMLNTWEMQLIWKEKTLIVKKEIFSQLASRT